MAVSGSWRIASFRVLVVLSLMLSGAACSRGESAETTPQPATPTPAYSGPGERVTIESTTQARLKGIAIGAGNIWEDEYTPPGRAARVGLTAALMISVAADPAKNSTVRVFPGQEVLAPGYEIHVIAIEERFVHLAVIQVE